MRVQFIINYFTSVVQVDYDQSNMSSYLFDVLYDELQRYMKLKHCRKFGIKFNLVTKHNSEDLEDFSMGDLHNVKRFEIFDMLSSDNCDNV